MKTTLDLPDDLARAVKIRAVEENRKLKDTIADLLRRGLAQKRGAPAVAGSPQAAARRVRSRSRAGRGDDPGAGCGGAARRGGPEGIMTLCDSNVWLALALSKHVHHTAAREWLETVEEPASVFFCRPTQQAFLRLLTNASVLANRIWRDHP
jgi:plasmid stability protein